MSNPLDIITAPFKAITSIFAKRPKIPEPAKPLPVARQRTGTTALSAAIRGRSGAAATKRTGEGGVEYSAGRKKDKLGE